MSKAYEFMTQSLATCSPDDNPAHVASVMKARDIGDVLIVEDGKLRGIVTDRDLALHALAGEGDGHNMPIRNIMTEKVITGAPDWSTSRVARTMARHQIRRLPIVQDGQLVGIVSLGDIARHANRKGLVTKSLKAISTDLDTLKNNGARNTGALVGLSLLALTSTAVALMTWNRSGKEIRKQMAGTKIYQSAQQAMSVARDKVDGAASSKTARNLRHQINTNIKELSSQLPRIEYKPPKKKMAWFR
jgi:CBS domain-containing protein/gas vesicle protein